MDAEVSLENVIRRCGDFNRFQLIHYVFLNLLNLGSGVTGFYYVFGLAEPLFRCRLPDDVWPNDDQFLSPNVTHQRLLTAFRYETSSCEGRNGTRCEQFVYDRQVFGRTFTEEANYICTDSMKKTWMATAYQIGTFSILLTGSISDRVGRRKMIQVLTVSLFFITIITQSLLQWVPMSIQTKFILLFINQVLSAVDSYSMSFLLLMELTSSSHTSLTCFISSIAYTIGEILIALFASLARDWLRLKWFISIYFALCLPYAYFVPESPYWLLSQKKYKELEKFLRKIARTNGESEEDWLPFYQQLTVESSKPAVKVTGQRPKWLRYLPRLVISGLIEFVTMLLYTKISYGLAASNGTLPPYWNMFLGAIVEAIGYLLASILITTGLGRKYSLILFAALTSICVLAMPFLMKSSPLLTTVVSQLGKLTVSSAHSVCWIYIPELFPTSMRGFANAVSVSVGSFGSILAPIVDEALGAQYSQISFYVYSALIIFLVCLVFPLPETRNRSFDDGEDRQG